MNQNRTLVLVLVGLVVVALGAVTATSLLRDPVLLDPTTPEGVVQAYVQAVLDTDPVGARSSFTDALAEDCSLADFAAVDEDDVSRVVVDEVEVFDGSATVEVTMTHTSGSDPLGSSSWDRQVTFLLLEADDQWKFDSIAWPYLGCEGSNR